MICLEESVIVFERYAECSGCCNTRDMQNAVVLQKSMIINYFCDCESVLFALQYNFLAAMLLF